MLNALCPVSALIIVLKLFYVTERMIFPSLHDSFKIKNFTRK